MPTSPAFLASFDDPGASAATAQTLQLGESVYGALETLGDRDWYEVSLIAGQNYVFRLLGVGYDVLRDPNLQVHDQIGNVVASQDDAGGDFTYNSVITFTPPTSGSYYVDAGGYLDFETGHFLLTVVEENPAGVVLTADEIAWQLTNNFERYFSHGDQNRNVSAVSYDVLSSERTITYDISGLTAAGQNLAEAALQMWSDVSAISFEPGSLSGPFNSSVQINFDDWEDEITAYNSNTLGVGNTIVRSDVMVSQDWLSAYGTGYGTSSFEAYVHELGHALGLGHGGNYNGTAEFGEDNFYLNDGVHLSIMSYMQFQSFGAFSPTYNSYAGADFRWVLTPAIADIIAIENLYGLSTTTRTGNTTYGYGSNTGNPVLDQLTDLNDHSNEDYVAFTLFDNGGIDTIDLSGFSGDQRIDLTEGALSDVLGGALNMGIAYGTVIERARGGAGDDELIGNAGVNRLDGGAGADLMAGGAGNDTYIVDQSGDVIIEYIGGGIDTVETTQNHTLDAGVERLVLTGFGQAGYGNSLANRLTGTDGADVLRGFSGDDTLIGNEGADTLWGGAGADVLAGGSGRDRAYYLDAGAGISASLANTSLNTGEAAGDTYTSIEDLTGTNYDDVLAGLAGNRNNTLRGGGGDDVLKGYSGADRLYGNDGDDFLEGGIGGDVLVGGEGRDTATYLQASSGVIVSMTALGSSTGDAAGDTFYSIEDLVGSSHDDRLEGNLSSNFLTGGAGADRFVFRALGAVDTVTDFTPGVDEISLYASGFEGLSGGALAPSAFHVSSTGFATDASHRILYNSTTGDLSFDVDGTGGAEAVIFARVDAGLALTVSDIFLLG